MLDSAVFIPHLIAITEIKYKNNRTFSNTEISLDGFPFYSNDFIKNVRGIGVYVRDDIVSSVVSLSSFQENIFVSIVTKLHLSRYSRDIDKTPVL